MKLYGAFRSGGGEKLGSVTAHQQRSISQTPVHNLVEIIKGEHGLGDSGSDATWSGLPGLGQELLLTVRTFTRESEERSRHWGVVFRSA